MMRTTVDMDAAALQAVRGLAARQRKTIGKVLSEIVIAAVTAPRDVKRSRTGIPLLPVDPASGVVTNELINRLRDETE